MKIFLDKVSFVPAYKAAYFDTMSELVSAGRTVQGSAARAEKAKLDLDDLVMFRTKLIDHIRNDSISTLPRLRTWLKRIPDCHHLTVGPWRGVFLVGSAPDLAVGLIFSKAPHRYSDRITELADFYRHPGTPSADEEDLKP